MANKEKYWKRDDKRSFLKALDAIRKMLNQIKSLWPRTEGQGWDIPKFHEQLHIPDNILQNGAPSGSHSGPLKHNHIQLVKRPSKKTQKRRKFLIFKLQIGTMRLI